MSTGWLLADSSWNAFLQQVLQSPVFAVGLTLVVYQLGVLLFQRLHRPSWLPPIVTGTLLLALVIYLLPVDYAGYYEDAGLITFLLGPATVALAIPLYLQFHHIRQLAMPVLVTLLVAAPLAIVIAVTLAWSLGADLGVLLSLAPKSVTAPIAVSLADILGGIGPLTVGVVGITGIFVSVITPGLCKLMKIDDERILGFVMGLTGHGAATARAFEISPTVGVFSSLALGLTGAFTAILLPLCLWWL